MRIERRLEESSDYGPPAFEHVASRHWLVRSRRIDHTVLIATRSKTADDEAPLQTRAVFISCTRTLGRSRGCPPG